MNEEKNIDNQTETIGSPIKAIRAKCLDCCYDQPSEVKLCPANGCPLWPFRLGKNPNRKARTFTEEQRKAAAERLKKAREAKKSS